MPKGVLSMFSFRVLVSGLTFTSLIYFEFIFVYGVGECSDFILLHVAVQFSQHCLLKRLSFLHCHKHFSEQAYVLEHLWSFYRIYTCINWFCSNTQQLGAAVHSFRSNGSLQSFSNHSLLLNSITKSIKMLLPSVGHHFCLDTRHGFSWSMLIFLVCSLAINCNSCLRFPSHYPYDLNVALLIKFSSLVMTFALSVRLCTLSWLNIFKLCHFLFLNYLALKTYNMGDE